MERDRCLSKSRNSFHIRKASLVFVAGAFPSFVELRPHFGYAVTHSITWELFSLNFLLHFSEKAYCRENRYGQQYYDYDKGVMTFVAPKQVLSLPVGQQDSLYPASGYALLVHPDFLYKHFLVRKIKNYGVFSYTVNNGYLGIWLITNNCRIHPQNGRFYTLHILKYL